MWFGQTVSPFWISVPSSVRWWRERDKKREEERETTDRWYEDEHRFIKTWASCHGPWAGLPVLRPLSGFYTWRGVSVDPTLCLPRLLLPLPSPKHLLCVCISIPALPAGSSAPFFWILYVCVIIWTLFFSFWLNKDRCADRWPLHLSQRLAERTPVERANCSPYEKVLPGVGVELLWTVHS